MTRRSNQPKQTQVERILANNPDHEVLCANTVRMVVWFPAQDSVFLYDLVSDRAVLKMHACDAHEDEVKAYAKRLVF